MKKIPRVMIAGTSSGCGKTTIVCGILSALKEMGVKAASAKCGPDYIDPMFHSQVFGIPSQNLDLFFCTTEQVNYLLSQNSKKSSITVMEGVMGFYDGMEMESTKASAYDLAKKTNTPVVLVVNAKGMAMSVLALIQGFLTFQKATPIKGIILNGVSGAVGEKLKRMIEERFPVKVYGIVPKMTSFTLASRHLGLVTPYERKNLEQEITKLGQQCLEWLDIKGLLELAETAPDVSQQMPKEWERYLAKTKEKNLRVGVAWDLAFCFYYKENLKILEKLGCELVYFSPLQDTQLPKKIDAVLIGGGYPELYAKQLSENKTMRQSIKKAIQNGLPTLAECGGFMYLHEQMEDTKGDLYPMVGVIAGKTIRKDNLVRFGYAKLHAERENPYLAEGEEIKAHEFHYWDSENNGDSFRAVKPSGKRNWLCVHAQKNMIAGFPHFYYYSNLSFIVRFLKKCK